MTPTRTFRAAPPTSGQRGPSDGEYLNAPSFLTSEQGGGGNPGPQGAPGSISGGVTLGRVLESRTTYVLTVRGGYCFSCCRKVLLRLGRDTEIVVRRWDGDHGTLCSTASCSRKGRRAAYRIFDANPPRAEPHFEPDPFIDPPDYIAPGRLL